MSDLNEIKDKLAEHEQRILDLEILLNSKPSPITIGDEEVILNLINSGFFDTQKKYGEIRKELKIQAKFDKKHNYKTVLEKITRENKLVRKMVSF